MRIGMLRPNVTRSNFLPSISWQGTRFANLFGKQILRVCKLMNHSVCFVTMLSLIGLAQNLDKTEFVNDVRVVQSVLPQVSSIIKLTHFYGTAVVAVSVGRQGNVIEVRFLEGHTSIQVDLRQAIQQWKFDPAPTQLGIRNVTLKFHYKILPRTAPDHLQGAEFLSPYELELRYKLIPREQFTLTPENYPHKGDLAEGQCMLHRERLRKDFVPIVYGLLAYDGKLERARTRLFPNDNQWIGGGCVVVTQRIDYGEWFEDVGPEKFQEVKYCQTCRHAAARWYRDHSIRTVNKREK